MENSNTNSGSRSAVVRSEFDKILMRHISTLIDTREDIASLPFNLATIACLLLLVERENEIKSFPESPPERYNRETFFSDLEDIGIDLDEEVLVAIQNLDQYGFVIVNTNNQYTARESASLLILVLDSIFPQMPGMNLVAYVSQAIEEVLTGRKEQDQALRQFDQTLGIQGVHLSALPKNRVPDSSIDRLAAPNRPDPSVLLERRTAYLQKLKALRERNLQASGDPAIVGVDSRYRKFEVQELFPRKVNQPSIEQPPEIPAPEEAEAPVEEPLPDDLPFSSMPPQDDEMPAEEHVPAFDEDLEPLESTQEPEPILDDAEEGIDAEEPSSETEPMAFEETPDAETEPDEILSAEEQIDHKIRMFEEDLAMPCPICSIGKVLSDTTEKGKTYYHCSNEECRLISWGKPYHLECPICKNPFLIETTDPDGKISLKCPRATCLYQKKSTVEEITDELNGTRKKKVAVVKKRGKRGVRRVVRRKS